MASCSGDINCAGGSSPLQDMESSDEATAASGKQREMDSFNGNNGLEESSHNDTPDGVTATSEKHEMGSFSGNESINGSAHGDKTNESYCESDAAEDWAAQEYVFEHVCTAPSHFYQLLGQLDGFRSSSLFCDAELIADDGTSIKAHRAILGAASPYFMAMFSGGPPEETHLQVEIGGVPSAVLKILVDSVYTGQLKLSQANVKEMIAAASMLQLSAAETMCTKFMCDGLDVCNALDVHRYAREGNFTSLANYASRFIHVNFEEISKSEGFLDLSIDELAEYLSSDCIGVYEGTLFRAALRWIEKSPEERCNYLNDVIKHMRISLLSSDTLMIAVSACKSAIVRDMMKRVKADIIKGRPRDHDVRKSTVVERSGTKTDIYIVGGWVEDKKKEGFGLTKDVKHFDTCSGEWDEPKGIRFLLSTVMREVQSEPGIASIGQVIYLVGGISGREELSTSGYAFRMHETDHADLRKMHGKLQVVRYDFGLCELDGYLYAFGGYNERNVLESIEKYDTGNRTWCVIDDMPKALYGMGVVRHGSLIYVIGGIGADDTFSQDFMSYNPETKEWNQLSPWLNPRRYMGVAVLGGHLYVVGGSGHKADNFPSDSVDVYSFEHDKWSKVAPLKWGLARAGVAAANGCLFVMGGEVVGMDGSIEVIADVMYYEPETDTWNYAKPMPLPRSQFRAIAL